MSCYNCHCNCCKHGEKHKCCWHSFSGPIWMVVPVGYIIKECCECGKTKLVHTSHDKECCRTKGEIMWKSERPSTIWFDKLNGAARL